MHVRLPGRSIVTVLSDIATVAFLLLPMMLAAAGVAGLVALAGLAVPLRWYVALIAAPALYVVWLFLYLLLSAATIASVGRRFPKPRFRAVPPGVRVRDAVREDLGVVTAVICYRRLAIVHGLPFSHLLGSMPGFARLAMRAWAPSVSAGQSFVSWGRIYDPDLTAIGDNVVIGGGVAIVAHSMSTRPDGSIVYISAPIRIGDRVTIGGESRVGLGCVIDDDAIVEPGAVVAAMTHIGAGEVWGGNPARLRRRREDVGALRDTAAPSNGVDQPDGASGDLRRLVLLALDLDDAHAPAELSSESCPAWDSLGQLAIAAAIFDRYGVSVHEDDVYRLRTLSDVGAAIAGRLPSDADDEPEEGGHDASGGVIALPDDRELLPLLDHQQATRALAARPAEPGGQPVEVVVAATFVAQPLASALRLWAGAFGFDVACRFADYDQIVQTLLDPRGQFAANHSGVNLVLARVEDLWAGSRPDSLARVEQIVAALGQHVADGAGPAELLVGTLPPAISTLTPVERDDAEWLRHEWRERIRSVPGVALLDVAGVVERVGVERSRDSAAEAHSRAPYSPVLYQELGIALARHVRSQRRSPAKVVAIDADNTLWGGVVGEVGLDGITLGEDGADRAFQLFQQELKRLKERGILLAVVSRNEEADVLEVFERHPGMILRADDIAAWSVGWGHKSDSLRALADEMSLGLDSFVFLDDDPAVRAEVAERAPEVHVLPLPADPSGYTETLARLWLFDGAQATAVDAARTRMMQEEGRRKRESRSAASLAEFLAGLELRVVLRPPDDAEWARVAQLTQRTNQFNLSLVRRTVEEARALAGEATVLTLTAADRFGDYGLVGVAVVRPPDATGDAEIDTLLMSCRALGRGVEDALLAGMAALAAGQGATTLVAPYVEGKRNAMVLDYLRRSGFVEGAPRRWVLPLAEPPAVPPHVAFEGPALAPAGVSAG